MLGCLGAWESVDLLTKWAVPTLLSRYLFWAAIFCSLLGSPFLPPPFPFPLFRALLFFVTITDDDEHSEGEYSSRSTSGVGDLGVTACTSLFLVEVLPRVGTMVGGRYSDEDSSSLLHTGLGYRLTGWGFATRKVLNRRGLTHIL
jgi:hypothetical protein